MIKFVAELTEFIPLQWYEFGLTEFIPLQWYEFGQPGNKLSHSVLKFYVCLQRADDELYFHISGPSIAQVLAKLSSQYNYDICCLLRWLARSSILLH